MKKFLSNLWWIILAIIVLGFIFVGVFDMFQDLQDVILNIGNGSWIKGLIFLPFATIGIIQVIRGFFAVVQKDLPEGIPYNSLSTKSKVLTWLYWITTILGYVILFISIQNIA